MDLRTGRVTEAAPVEGADKLICLQVDLGFEERQVLAGIAEQYDPAEMETVSASAAKRPAPADGWGETRATFCGTRRPSLFVHRRCRAPNCKEKVNKKSAEQ